MGKIEVDVDVKLLPQLLVMSAITESPGGGNYPFISNRYCMVKDNVELEAELDKWVKRWNGRWRRHEQRKEGSKNLPRR